MSDFRTIGEWLKFHRLAANLNQRELAALAGVSKTTVSNIETNKVQARDGTPIRPEIPTIDALAEALKIDAAPARMLAYPPEDRTQPVIITSGRVIDMHGTDIAQTISRLRCEAQRHSEIAAKLNRTASDLERLLQ